ncbi:MAG: SOS response-associated peptidase [Alphaproteobacteria bacterium]|nr:SOS response-associated peptidase [Alphaproteobacteria bacterium]
MLIPILMCGRYSLTTPIEGIRALFDIDALPNLAPRYNIAPTQPVVTVRAAGDGGGRELAMMRWGLIPSWAKDPAIGSRMINARAETVAEKPAFRAAFRRRRCLIPADGFYEWEKRQDGKKQPWRITLEGGVVFAFAGLWESWLGADGSEVDSCTIVTTVAAPAIAAIHPRMPVILDPTGYETWLTGEPDAAGALLGPYGGSLEAHPISTRINNVRNDDASVLEAVSDDGAEEEPPAQRSLF